MELHPAIGDLAFLLGTWRGRGHGDYPTIEAFEYTEEVTFGHVGKPFLTYHQRTWGPQRQPLHTESGYLRPVGKMEAEFIVAQPTGITEIHRGRVDLQTIRFVTDSVTVSPTAKDVRAVTRTMTVDGDTLSYRLDMEAVGEDLQFHLEADLIRD